MAIHSLCILPAWTSWPNVVHPAPNLWFCMLFLTSSFDNTILISVIAVSWKQCKYCWFWSTLIVSFPLGVLHESHALVNPRNGYGISTFGFTLRLQLLYYVQYDHCHKAPDGIYIQENLVWQWNGKRRLVWKLRFHWSKRIKPTNQTIQNSFIFNSKWKSMRFWLGQALTSFLEIPITF